MISTSGRECKEEATYLSLDKLLGDTAMLGDDLRHWFELFDSIVIYKPQPDGGHASDSWLNWSDIEGRFKSEGLTFCGQRYNPSDEAQRNRLLEALIGYANTFVRFWLLEKRRLISPPSLDYRLTKFGRLVGNWGYGDKPGFKKRALFFVMALAVRAYRFRWVLVVGTTGWAILNATRFYITAASWIDTLPFAVWSALVIFTLTTVYGFIKAKLSGGS
jgi:hypothetical protein